MTNTQSPAGIHSILRLIFVPTLISLVVTLWRLTGELLAWSESWFNPEAGGSGSIVGITWLAPIFGGYFGLQLSKRGVAPASWTKAFSLALLGFVILFVGGWFQAPIYVQSYQAGLIYIWLVGVIAAAVQYPVWPALFKTLLAYGLAARVPVVVIMFLALWGDWGTHYDALPRAFPGLGWFAKFLWLGLFPQILFWVGFTIVTGMLFGVAAAWLREPRNAVPT